MNTKFGFQHWIVTVLALTLITAPVAFAADNTATGNVAGVDADLNDSNTITLNTTTLSLVKAAFLQNGTPLVSGATLPRGTMVKFVVYVDNTTAFATDSINVSDVLAAGFQYLPGSIKVDASANTGSTAAAIYAAVDAAANLTDAVSGADVAGFAANTVSAGNSAGNALVTVPAGKVWAMEFTVRMQ
jgi:hypothetical protein